MGKDTGDTKRCKSYQTCLDLRPMDCDDPDKGKSGYCSLMTNECSPAIYDSTFDLPFFGKLIPDEY